MIKELDTNEIIQKYREVIYNIVNNPNLKNDEKKVQLNRLIRNLASKVIRADNKVEINKFFQKINSDKLVGAEILLASLAPLMGVGLYLWGTGSNVDRAVFEKAVSIMFDGVVPVSAFCAFAGLGTIMLEKPIANKVDKNVKTGIAKKEALEESLRSAVAELRKMDGEMEQEI